MADPKYETITEQLTGYCDCQAKKIDDKDIEEMVSLVSMATCWADSNCQGNCATFLLEDRREVIDLPSCMECMYEFAPHFRPFVEESFTFTMIRQDETGETSTPLTNFWYSELDCKFHIDLGLPSCKCKCKQCGCEPKYKLLVEYVAGYETLPECLLPVFCNLLEVIHAKNDCCCDTECGCNKEGEDIKYATGDVVTVQVETDLGKLIAQLTTEMLGVMSICEQNSPIWGVIV